MSKQPATDQWLLQFLTYEDYLDSLVTAHDLLYLRSREAARTIAELGYRNPNTLSREQFEHRRRAAALFQTPALLEQRDCSLLAGPISDALLVALADRERANRRGDLATIIFIRLVDRAGHQVSGYVDFAHRIASESWLRIFSGAKKLWPRCTDLGYFNWHTRVTKTNSSPNFTAITEPREGLMYEHTGDHKLVRVGARSSTSPGGRQHTVRTSVSSPQFLQAVLYDHPVRRRS
ncbi:cilia- and flagella-associated protein 299-like [Schistocerca nitens]|uniref:cilia- and flagella-associated protein 299-like n=1 Tax=Schistocerca nitens TaxID=7011 RepID=UPI002119624F|nr:cilia- and flagella-associated protein 299-like [Schistocerca nitens]